MKMNDLEVDMDLKTIIAYAVLAAIFYGL